MANFTQSKSFKSFINKAYGLGAAVVLLGALFKLQHWPFAGVMLSIGMFTECIIFVISAFEPVEKSYQWDNVFPELVGEGNDEGTSLQRGGVGTAPQINLDIDQEQTDRLKGGLEKLGNTIDQLTSLAAVAEASARLTENLDRATQSVGSVTGSAGNLSEAYITTAASINSISEQTKKGMESLASAQAGYKDQMNFLNKNLAAVNSSFELQLQDNERYRENYDSLNKEIGSLVGTVKKSVDQTQRLSSDMASLNDNVAKLNTVYGSMLTAVTSVLNK
ncbi:MAG: gliding motility protein GldL [Prevotellaceae bacterium]|jgi:gliding motility-associated protein GldL|nr:gliding motility protein GldL [Prevotellaceae bacterium]